jgi:hypothetical protein
MQKNLFIVQKVACILLAIFFSASILNAQSSGWTSDWRTYNGGSKSDFQPQVRVSGSRAFLGGVTFSPDLPITIGSGYQGGEELFITCLDTATGNVIWSRYLGGSKGDNLMNFTIDGNRVYITATTDGFFPVTIGPSIPLGSSDVTVTALDASNGSIIWSRLLGGNSREWSNDIVVSGNRLLVGLYSVSDDYPYTIPKSPVYTVHEGAQKSYAINALDILTGNVIWSAHNGMHWNPAFSEFTPQLAVTGNQVVCLLTTNFKNHPTTDGSILKGSHCMLLHGRNLNNGSLLWSKYLGGKDSEYDYGIYSGGGNVFAISYTQSPDFPITNGTVLDAVQKASTTITSVQPVSGTFNWSSYYPVISFLRADYSATGNLNISGVSDDKFFPVTIGSIHQAGQSVAVSIRAFDGVVRWSRSLGGRLLPTFFNGTSNTRHWNLETENGKIYLGGISTTGYSSVPSTDGSTNGSSDYRSTLVQLDESSGAICMVSKLGGANKEFQTVFDVKGSQVFLAAMADGNGFGSTNSSTFSGGDFDWVFTSLFPVHTFNTSNVISPNSQVICLGGPLQRINGNIVQAQGCMLPMYQWQISNSGTTGPWSDISGAIAQNYVPSSTSGDRWYRRVVIDPQDADTVSVSNISYVSISSLNAPSVEAGANGYTCPFTPFALGGSPTVSGGTPPYSFDWDFGQFLDDSMNSNPNATIIANTIFTLSVTDSNGCQNIDQVVVTLVDANAGDDQTFCAGQQPVRIGTAPVTGAPAVYNWFPSAGLSCSDCPRPFASPSITTAYVLSITLSLADGGTCITTDTVIVTVIDPPSPNFAGDDVLVCFNNPNSFTIGNTPEPDFSYVWAPGFYLSSNNQSQVAFNSGVLLPNPNPFNYYLTAVQSGCSWYDSMQVIILKADAGIDGCGSRTIGAGNQHPSIPAVYNWTVISGPDLLTGPRNQPVASVGGSETETSVYQLEVCYNGVCCTDEVVVPPCACNVMLQLDGGVVCPVTVPGDTVALVAYGSIEGAPLVEYSWSPCAYLNTCSGQSVQFTDDSLRTITVTVSAPGYSPVTCSASLTLNDPDVSVPVFEAGGPFYFCDFKTSFILGEPAVAGYGYFWTSNSGEVYFDAAPKVTPKLAHNYYYVTVTDLVTGCTFNDTAEVIYRAPAGSAGEDVSVCSNAVVTLGTPDASNGIYQYAWSPGFSPWQNGTDSTYAQPQVLVATDLTFTLVITDTSSGCQLTDQINIFILDGPDLPINSDQQICKGDEVMLGTTEVPGYIYNWSPAIGLSCTHCPFPYAAPDTTTTYFLHVQMDGDCAFDFKDTVTITVLKAPEFELGDTLIHCPNDPPLSIGENAPLGMTSYSWVPDVYLSPDAYVSNPAANPPNSITYTLFAYDDSGCPGTDDITILMQVSQADAGKDKAFCDGISVILGGDFNEGLPLWTGDDVSLLSCSDCYQPLFTPNGPGTYQFVLTLENDGCISSDTVILTVYPLPEFSLGDTLPACMSDGSVALGNNVPVGMSNYYWYPWWGLDPGANVPNPTTMVYDTTSYSLLVISTEGCQFSDTVVLYPANIQPFAGGNVSSCDLSPVTLGNPDIVGNIIWTGTDGLAGLSCTNCPEPVFTPVDTGVYVFYVQSTLNGCVLMDSVIVNVRYSPEFTLPSPILKCPATEVELNPNLAGLCADCNYMWSPSAMLGGSGAFSINPVTLTNSAINYTLTVTDPYGCQSSGNVQVNLQEPPNVSSIFSVCLGESLQLGDASNDVGTVWTPSDYLSCAICPQPVFTPPSVGSYTLQAQQSVMVNGKMCTQNAAATIQVQSILVPPLSQSEILCQDGCVQLGVSGASSLSYVWTPASGLSCQTCQQPIACPSNSTLYTVTAIDLTTGCSDERNVNVTVINNAAPVVTVPDYEACPGVPFHLTPVISPEGDYDYEWSPSTGLSNPYIADPVALVNFPVSYTLTVTNNEYGCYSMDNSVISMLSDQACASILPVEWVHFNAYPSGTSSVLKWMTASEMNNNGFEIERSLNGLGWEYIGFVKGAGNSVQPLNYQFIDESPNLNSSLLWYYRLKQVDFDGLYQFSPMRFVEFDLASDGVVPRVTWYPNPTKGDIIVHSNTILSEISVFDLSGRIVYHTNPDAKEFNLSLPSLLAGTYVIRYIGEMITGSEKLIIRY